MIDWTLLAEVAGGGCGIAILVLLILALAVWLVGRMLQMIPTKNKEKSAKKE